MKRIVFLVPYPPGKAPSQRFRFEQYFAKMRTAGHVITLLPFYTGASWRILYSNKNRLLLVCLTLYSFLRRTTHLFKTFNADIVFIHREIAPLGPPFFEWTIAKVFGKKIIYDFDDAIWLTEKTCESRWLSLLKWRSKVASICRWSYAVTCGNEFLKDFASQHSDRTYLIPTTIDTTYHQKSASSQAKPNQEKITIGWTGSHSTLVYLLELVPVLQFISHAFPDTRFLVIANKDPELPLENYRFIPWQKEREIQDLALIDIGIMPLIDDEWARGKCGFKALQYMSLGIPSVISPVGTNRTILTHGKEGYHASTKTEWIEYLTRLLRDPMLRRQMGSMGRKTVHERYSVDAVAPEFLSLFER